MKENNMKPKRLKKIEGNGYDGKCGDKSTLSRALTHVQPPAQLKPLRGKLVYLDLPSNRLAETLERDIIDLGGIVEKFFSKEIKYLVTNKREAKYVRDFKCDSPVPSPEPGSPAPNPAMRCSDKRLTQAGTCVASRGKSLVERVVKEKERVQMNKILSNALEWGVKILYIDDVMNYIDKKKKSTISQSTVAAGKPNVRTGPAANQGVQKHRGGRISKPFVKVEDSSKHFRPIYLMMPNMPELNRKTVPPATPFYLNEKESSGNKPRNANASASEGKTHARKKFKERKRAGYCECCLTKYENLATHLQSEHHKDFSKSENYLVVDKLISAMHCSFPDLKTDVKRPKCSVLLASGLKQGADVDTRKERLADNCTQASLHSSLGKKTVPLPGDIHREEDKRIFPCSRLRRVCYARKRPRQQNAATSCTQKSNETTCLKTEMPPSGGEYRTTVAQVDALGQLSDADISTSHNNKTVSHSAESRQTESSLADPEQHGHTSPKRTTGPGHSETEGATLHAPTSPPVQTLQRKVRPPKPKRQKDTPFVGHKRLRSSIDPIRRLWEIFQSSDDMDVEFMGFED